MQNDQITAATVQAILDEQQVDSYHHATLPWSTLEPLCRSWLEMEEKRIKAVADEREACAVIAETRCALEAHELAALIRGRANPS